jgi:hypothetical protein
MNVETPQAISSERQGDILQSTITRSPPVDAVSDTSADFSAATADDDDDVIEVAYHEIRRSVSPQVAQYIFQSGEDDLCAKNNLAGARWTIDRILNIPVTPSELRQLSEESFDILIDLGTNLWAFGKRRYWTCCAHIGKVLLARERLVSLGTRSLDTKIKNLAQTYMVLNRMAECEALLTSTIAEIHSLRPGDPACNEFRSILGVLHSRQGQYTLAEELCTQAMISLSCTLGLTHKMTWFAYQDLHLVLREQGRFDDALRLMTEFYIDIYQIASVQVLPGFIFSLELCERYIEEWMAESELQRLVRDRFVDDGSLGNGERMALTLDSIVRNRWRVEFGLGFFPQIMSNLREMVGLDVVSILSHVSILVARHIQGVRHCESILLRQGALRAVKDLRSTNFLAPLFVFHFLNYTNFLKNESYWRNAEQDLIHSLENLVNENECPPDGRNLQLSGDAGYPKSTSVMTDGHAVPRSDAPNSSDSSIRATTASCQALSAEISSHTVGFNSGTAMPSAVSSATFFRPIPQPSSASNQSPVSANDDHIELVNTLSLPTRNPEPYTPQPWSHALRGQLSSEGQSNNGFLPTMMDAVTPPFTWSLPQTPQASHMFPPPSPARDSLAPVPSSALAGYLDFSGSSNLFGLPQLPIPPSPSFGSSSSPRS